MKVTVLVCTRNRPDIIESCISSILNNTYHDFEFLIVDQSTDEKTEKIVKKHINVDKRVRYIRMNATGKTKALNLGIKESLGDIIAQTDDDCVANKDWVEKIVDAFEKNTDVAIIFGSVIDNRTLTKRKGRRLIKDGKFSGRLSKLSFIGDAANRSVKKMVYQKIKGHDELLGIGTPLLGSEDQDFMYRVLKAGFKVLTVKDIIVTHYMYRIRDVESYLSVLRGYLIGSGALYLKHFRCLDFFAIVILFSSWMERIFRMTRFILSGERLAIKKPRIGIVLLFYSWIVVTYWIILGIVKSLKYPVDKTYGLFISK